MANLKVCVNISCNRSALHHRRTLCKVHFLDPKAPGEMRFKITPTTLPEWEWIKKELNL